MKEGEVLSQKKRVHLELSEPAKPTLEMKEESSSSPAAISGI
jgi:hypothetical protein